MLKLTYEKKESERMRETVERGTKQTPFCDGVSEQRSTPQTTATIREGKDRKKETNKHRNVGEKKDGTQNGKLHLSDDVCGIETRKVKREIELSEQSGTLPQQGKVNQSQ